MIFEEAEQLCKDGATKIKRIDWTPIAYLRIYNGEAMLLDVGYGAYWDLNKSDKAATDWVNEESLIFP